MKNARISKIIQEFPLKKLPGVPESVSEASILDALLSADPTPRKKCFKWLVSTWSLNFFLWEDIRSGERSDIGTILHDFYKIMSYLPARSRSLYEYKTPGDMWRKTQEFLPRVGVADNEIYPKKSTSRKAHLESLIFYQGRLKCIIPITPFASQFWGQGTRWCTSARYSDNMFVEYMVSSPLIIFILPTGEKFQGYVGGDDGDDIISFMNEADQIPDAEEQTKLAPFYDDIVVALHKTTGWTDKFITFTRQGFKRALENSSEQYQNRNENSDIESPVESGEFSSWSSETELNSECLRHAPLNKIVPYLHKTLSSGKSSRYLDVIQELMRNPYIQETLDPFLCARLLVFMASDVQSWSEFQTMKKDTPSIKDMVNNPCPIISGYAQTWLLDSLTERSRLTDTLSKNEQMIVDAFTMDIMYSTSSRCVDYQKDIMKTLENKMNVRKYILGVAQLSNYILFPDENLLNLLEEALRNPSERTFKPVQVSVKTELENIRSILLNFLEPYSSIFKSGTQIKIEHHKIIQKYTKYRED